MGKGVGIHASENGTSMRHNSIEEALQRATIGSRQHHVMVRDSLLNEQPPLWPLWQELAVAALTICAGILVWWAL